jgi:hypothetical protein
VRGWYVLLVAAISYGLLWLVLVYAADRTGDPPRHGSCRGREEPGNLSFVGANPGSNLRVISVLVFVYSVLVCVLLALN